MKTELDTVSRSDVPAFRIACIVEMHRMVRFFLSVGAVLVERNGFGAAEVAPTLLNIRDLAQGKRPESPLARFNSTWGSDRFERDDSGWPAVQEYDRGGHDTDRDKKPLRNGDTKYFRDRSGRLQRATVYTNMNNMWAVYYGGSVTFLGGSHLFDCDEPDKVPRRFVPGQIKRLETEASNALKARDYRRLERISRALSVKQKQKAA